MLGFFGHNLDLTLIEARYLPPNMRTNRILNRHPSQWISLLALVGAGLMAFITSTNAGGGATVDIGISLKDGLGKEPVWVGLGILLFVYALIITEVVHRTLAAAVGGLAAIVALNHYKAGSALSLAETTTLIEWETIGLAPWNDGDGWDYLSHRNFRVVCGSSIQEKQRQCLDFGCNSVRSYCGFVCIP